MAYRFSFDFKGRSYDTELDHHDHGDPSISQRCEGSRSMIDMYQGGERYLLMVMLKYLVDKPIDEGLLARLGAMPDRWGNFGDVAMAASAHDAAYLDCNMTDDPERTMLIGYEGCAVIDPDGNLLLKDQIACMKSEILLTPAAAEEVICGIGQMCSEGYYRTSVRAVREYVRFFIDRKDELGPVPAHKLFADWRAQQAK